MPFGNSSACSGRQPRKSKRTWPTPSARCQSPVANGRAGHNNEQTPQCRSCIREIAAESSAGTWRTSLPRSYETQRRRIDMNEILYRSIVLMMNSRTQHALHAVSRRMPRPMLLPLLTACPFRLANDAVASVRPLGLGRVGAETS